jgi:hypothetical protein
VLATELMTGGARRPGVALALIAVVLVAGLVAAPFFVATTFVGDDHVFLAFARLAPNPLVAFVRDQHGGEFYRPLPLLVWWLLGRAAHGASWPFGALALGLHAGAAALLAWLLASLGRPRAVAWLAGALFLLAPQNLDAASWYAASTDLLATALALASLVALVREAPLASAALALGAFLSKEAALVLPALAYVVWGAQPGAPPPARRARRLLPQAALAVLVLVVRAQVLGGWGGSGDEQAPLVPKLLQLAGGLVHVFTGATLLPEPVAWGLGLAALVLVGLAAARGTSARRPLVFVALALAPLLAPGWFVGARYFYLPSVGLAWAAAEALAAVPWAARVVLCAGLAVVGGLEAGARGRDVTEYDRRLAAVRRAVVDGAREGARVFHVVSGIKDLDLAVKEDPAVAPFAADLLVLSDVPASFVELPPTLETRASFLLAAPPLPPSGAYRFGAARIVGLARRGDDPTLDEVLVRFPDIRFIRLRATPGGHIIARDVTDTVKASD